MKIRLAVIVIVLFTSFITACAVKVNSSPTAVVATPTAVWHPFRVDEVKVSFRVPSDWTKTADWVWNAPDSSGWQLGFQWSPITTTEAGELFLPPNSTLLGSEPAAIGWATGRRYDIIVYNPSQPKVKPQLKAYEHHIAVIFTREGQRIGLDFYASAKTEAELDALLPALVKMIDSAAKD
ncbi:MAG: hypothetical protein ACYCZF_17265 [Anaerolineae bacterium]